VDTMKSAVLAIAVGLCEINLAHAQSAQPAPPTPAPASSPAAPPTATPSPAAPSQSAVTAEANAHVAEADRLFKQGVASMDARDYVTACPLFEQSQRLDSSSGTLLNLGDCYEQVGRTASAWRTFQQASEVAQATGRRDRVPVAEVRRDRLLPRLRQIKILLPSRPVPDLTLRLDGVSLPPPWWGAPLYVDPGVHNLRANAPGLAEYATNIEAPRPGETAVVQLPEFALTPDIRHEPTSAPPPPNESSSTRSDPRMIAAIAAGAVGVVGVVTGSIFGVRSMSKHNESDKYCSGSRCWDPRGVEAMDQARSAGTVSTVAFVIGAAGLGAGAVLWFTRPSESESGALGVRVTPTSVGLHGTW